MLTKVLAPGSRLDVLQLSTRRETVAVQTRQVQTSSRSEESLHQKENAFLGLQKPGAWGGVVPRAGCYCASIECWCVTKLPSHALMTASFWPHRCCNWICCSCADIWGRAGATRPGLRLHTCVRFCCFSLPRALLPLSPSSLLPHPPFPTPPAPACPPFLRSRFLGGTALSLVG